MKRVLMVAYHFPPLAGSSGIQRTLRFAAHLPELGWEPIVLTAHPRSYERVGNDAGNRPPAHVEVLRAPAWDTKRHFGIRGWYPGFLARPDRWQSWWLGAVPVGLKAIARHKPAAIWCTYPIATALRIGVTLARITKVPLVADLRDLMAHDGYPSDPATWRAFRTIEERALSAARFSTFTSPGAVRFYKERYPAYASRFRLVENGYDEESFAAADSSGGPLNEGKLTLLHSGIVYPSERDPTCLFDALAELRRKTPEAFGRLAVRFRAAVHDDMLRDLARRFGVEDAVQIMPLIGYADAVREMCRADGLLILQGRNCNAQIPAKFYEYLRARRPVLVLADPHGDTGQTALAAGISSIAPLEDSAAIAAALEQFLAAPAARAVPAEEAVIGSSRRARTAALAALLNEAAG